MVSINFLPLYRIGLKPAELIFVVDVTEDNNFDITVKFMYNIIRLFKLGTVRVSFVSFGRRPRLRFLSTPMPKIKQIQTQLTRITPSNDKKTNAGAALEFVRTSVTSKIKPSVPRVVVLIMRGGSDDNVLSPSRKLKGSGVIIVSVGKLLFIFMSVRIIANYRKRSIKPPTPPPLSWK